VVPTDDPNRRRIVVSEIAHIEVKFNVIVWCA
jgi:hypothetical protein